MGGVERHEVQNPLVFVNDKSEGKNESTVNNWFLWLKGASSLGWMTVKKWGSFE